jgi:uncharacterized protein (DUF4415 family)
MNEEYNLDTMKFRPSTYSKLLTEEITIHLENDVIDYFKEMAKGVGLPYQSLINLYLKECMTSGRELKM